MWCRNRPGSDRDLTSLWTHNLSCEQQSETTVNVFQETPSGNVSFQFPTQQISLMLVCENKPGRVHNKGSWPRFLPSPGARRTSKYHTNCRNRPVCDKSPWRSLDTLLQRGGDKLLMSLFSVVLKLLHTQWWAFSWSEAEAQSLVLIKFPWIWLFSFDGPYLYLNTGLYHGCHGDRRWHNRTVRIIIIISFNIQVPLWLFLHVHRHLKFMHTLQF